MRRAEIIGLPPPRTGAAALTGAIASPGSFINNANMCSRSHPSPHQLPHQSNDWPSVARSIRQWTDAALRGATPERARASPTAHAAVEGDGLTLGVDVRMAVAVRGMAVDHLPGARTAEPCLEPQRLPAKYASGGHPADQGLGVPSREQPADLVVDRIHGVRLARRNEGAKLVAVAVLGESAALQHQHGRAPQQPRLQRLVPCQLLEVVWLASRPEPGVDSRSALGPVAEGSQHQDLVIAEEDDAVWAVASIAEGAHAEGAAVHEVAQEDRAPPVGWVGLERSEEALEVSMDVADDEDGQVSHGGRSRAELPQAALARTGQAADRPGIRADRLQLGP